MPLISVIIPCYNYAQYLPNAINCVLEQQKDNYETEIIVVNDGSPDNTAEICQGFGPAIRYIEQENQGLSAARNTGMTHAKGDYLIFLDADDLLGPNTLASQLANFKAHPELDASVCMCICGDLRFDDLILWPSKSAHLDLHLCHSNISPVHTFMIRSDLAAKVGYFNTKLKACEDYEYWLRCAEKKCVFGANPDAFVYYAQHDKSMSHQMVQQWMYDKAVHGQIAGLLETASGFPRAGKFYGWLAYAAGCISSSYGLNKFSEPLANKVIEEAATAMLKAAAMTPKSLPEDSQLILNERFFISEYLVGVRTYGVEHSKNIGKSYAFIEKRYPNLVSRSLEQQKILSGNLRAKLLCDSAKVQADFGRFRKAKRTSIL